MLCAECGARKPHSIAQCTAAVRAHTGYEQNGCIVFANSKGLPGVGFPRNAKPKDGDPIGWNDIKDLQSVPDQES